MKKSVTFFWSFFITAGMAAQYSPLPGNVTGNSCGVLSKILAEAPQQFKKIKIGETGPIYATDVKGWEGFGWKTSVNFPGALVSYIKWDLFDVDKYFAFFGNYTSEAMASINLYAIKAQLATCLSGFAAITYDQSNPWVNDSLFGDPIEDCPLVVEYTGKKTGNMRAPVIQLKIKKEKSVFGVYLEIKQYGDKNAQSPEIKQPVTEKATGNKTKFAKDLEQLLEYAKDGFKAIKGEEIVDQSSKELKEQLANIYFDKKVYSKFKTSFLPEGAEKSEVRYYPADKSTKFIASYRYYFYPESSFRVLFNKMKKELGNDFIAEVDEQSINKKVYDKSQKVVFYPKGSKQPQIELIFNNDDTIINGMPPGILIVVEALKNQSNVADNKPATKDITGNETILKIWQNDNGQGAQTNLAKQLLELLDYAKDRFKTIKGGPDEAIKEKNKYSGATYFKTSIALKEAVENYIEETSSAIKFKADFGKNLTEREGKELFKDLSKKIKEGAWDDFEIKEYSGYIFGDYLRVRRKNDYTHTILLTFDDGEHDDSSPKVYITVE